MTSLLVIKGPNIGVRYELGDSTRIGRADENEIQVADAGLSRVHAEIIRSRMAFTIYDRESRNGVVVNGTPVFEKVLLKNDEIRVGNTVFLFNSDLNIQNARYTDNSVYLYPAEDETVAIAQRQSQLDSLTGRERESIEFILRFSDLFAMAPAPLAETSSRLLSQLMGLFSADAAILLVRDSTTGELRPAAALPTGVSAAVNRKLVNSVAGDGICLLSSETASLEDVGELPGGEDTPGEAWVSPPLAEFSTMCAPVIQEDTLIAIIVVEKRERDFYSLRDLGLLQAVAKLAVGAIQASYLAEKLAVRDKGGSPFAYVPSRSLRVQEVFAEADRAAQANVTILITGESGTGKEILARFIHDKSSFRSGPYLPVNCGAIPANLFESELFGYEKGAFTGATRTTPGKIEAAEGGTLFLDEIGELTPELQPKLLRFIQERVFFRVGGTRAISSNVRIIAATNTDLETAVREERFRQDLWYRLNVVRLQLPPLRERREDILPLAENVIARAASRGMKNVLGINDAAINLLQKYSWPGNIRELENAVERAIIVARNKILNVRDFAHIEDALRTETADATAARKKEIIPLAELERQHIVDVLKRVEWNQVQAAEALGIHRNTLRNKMLEYGIQQGR